MIVDLKNNFDKNIFNKFSNLVRWIENNENHRNAKNYFNLDKKIEEFDCFELLLDSEQNIIAFSGLYNNKCYPSNIARACTRTYYTNRYRNKGLARNNKWVEKFLILYELKKAMDIGYEFVFISINDYALRRSIQHLNVRLNQTTEFEWKVHPQMCNTCRLYNDENKYIGINNNINCWQNVCYTNIKKTDSLFNLPVLHIEEYKKNFIN